MGKYFLEKRRVYNLLGLKNAMQKSFNCIPRKRPCDDARPAGSRSSPMIGSTSRQEKTLLRERSLPGNAAGKSPLLSPGKRPAPHPGTYKEKRSSLKTLLSSYRESRNRSNAVRSCRVIMTNAFRDASASPPCQRMASLKLRARPS